jgi:hypothetical protein
MVMAANVGRISPPASRVGATWAIPRAGSPRITLAQ